MPPSAESTTTFQKTSRTSKEKSRNIPGDVGSLNARKLGEVIQVVDCVIDFEPDKKRDSEVREFKVLMALVKVMMRINYSGALKVFETITEKVC